MKIGSDRIRNRLHNTSNRPMSDPAEVASKSHEIIVCNTANRRTQYSTEEIRYRVQTQG